MTATIYVPPATTGGALPDVNIYAGLRASGFDGLTAVVMTAVVLAESGGDPSATGKPNRNGTVDRGLAQINSVHGHEPSKLYDPAYNLAAAHAIYLSQGLGAWSAYNNGKYLAFMPRATAAANGRAANGQPAWQALGAAWAPAGGAGPVASTAGLGGAQGFTGGLPGASQVEALADLVKFLGRLTEWDTWRRVLFVVGGGGLVVVGLSIAGADLSGAGKIVSDLVGGTKGTPAPAPLLERKPDGTVGDANPKG